MDDNERPRAAVALAILSALAATRLPEVPHAWLAPPAILRHRDDILASITSDDDHGQDEYLLPEPEPLPPGTPSAQVMAMQRAPQGSSLPSFPNTSGWAVGLPLAFG